VDVQKYKSFAVFYPVAFFVTAVTTVAAIAYVTNTVLVESSGSTFDEEIYLQYIGRQVDGTLPFAIAVGCVALFLEYKFLSRLKGRAELEKGLHFTMGTGIMSFAAWLSHAMFHGLSGYYPLISQAVTWLSLIEMVACCILLYIESRRKLSVAVER